MESYENISVSSFPKDSKLEEVFFSFEDCENVHMLLIIVFSSGQWMQPVTYSASDVATPKKQGSEWEEKLREDCGHHCTLQSFLFTAKLWVCESERERKRTYCLSLGRVKRALYILFHWSHCFCSILKCSGRSEQMQEYVWVLRSADLDVMTLKTELDLVK